MSKVMSDTPSPVVHSLGITFHQAEIDMVADGKLGFDDLINQKFTHLTEIFKMRTIQDVHELVKERRDGKSKSR